MRDTTAKDVPAIFQNVFEIAQTKKTLKTTRDTGQQNTLAVSSTNKNTDHEPPAAMY